MEAKVRVEFQFSLARSEGVAQHTHRPNIYFNSLLRDQLVSPQFLEEQKNLIFQFSLARSVLCEAGLKP